MDMLTGFVFGVFGGFMSELLGFYRMRHQTKNHPDWITSKFYWATTIAMILVGGGLVDMYIYSGLTLNAALAVNIGASAPFIIGGALEQAPKLDIGATD